MSDERERIDHEVQATRKRGKEVRERALREFGELERVLREEVAARPPAPPPDEEVPWWRKHWS